MAHSSLSDSDFEDVVEEQSPADAAHEQVARGKSKAGKLVRGKDVHWVEVEVFDDAQEFFASNIYKKLKQDFTVSRKRQFEYAHVIEYRCRFSRKVGYLPCTLKMRVSFLSHCQEVKIETNHISQEHLHEEDPQADLNKISINYRWTPKMTDFIEQCVKNHGKPKVALR